LANFKNAIRSFIYFKKTTVKKYRSLAMALIEILISLVIVIGAIVSFYYTFHLIIKIAKNTENRAKDQWCQKNRDLFSQIRMDFDKVYDQSQNFQKESKLLLSVVGKNIEDTGVIESDKAIKFKENLVKLNELLDKCNGLTESLKNFQKQECDTQSPEIFYENLKKEYETIQEILTIYKQVRSLFNENVDIISPLLKERSR
jgi:hypothetical protein